MLVHRLIQLARSWSRSIPGDAGDNRDHEGVQKGTLFFYAANFRFAGLISNKLLPERRSALVGSIDRINPD